MGENAGIETNAPDVSQGFEGTQTTAPETNNQPPYAEQLNSLPESVRPLVEPIFQDWDKGVNKRFQDLHSQYEPYKPFVEQFEPEALAQAIQLAQLIENDPQQVYNALAEAYGFGQAPNAQQGVAGQQGNQEVEEENPLDPRLQQHEELLATMAQFLVQQQEQQQAQQEDNLLDQVLTQMKSQYGEFDETFVLTQMANGVDPTQAIQRYNQIVEQALQARRAPAAPTVMGSGGGVPTTNVPNPSSLSSKDTKALVAQMLEAAATQQ